MYDPANPISFARPPPRTTAISRAFALGRADSILTTTQRTPFFSQHSVDWATDIIRDEAPVGSGADDSRIPKARRNVLLLENISVSSGPPGLPPRSVLLFTKEGSKMNRRRFLTVSSFSACSRNFCLYDCSMVSLDSFITLRMSKNECPASSRKARERLRSASAAVGDLVPFRMPVPAEDPLWMW